MKPELPSKYRFSYNYAFFLHDILAQIILDGEANNIFEVEFGFMNSEELGEFNKIGLEGQNIWDWLEKNGYNWVNKEYAKKQVFLAVLSDMCDYLFESLKCSQKGKQSVAFSLLRKPLKDNLFILEWLLADPDDFSDKFLNHKINELAIDKISKERKQFVINESISKCKSSYGIDAEYLYEVRYEKSSLFGYEPSWNKATHLITTCKHYTTDPININFVFSNNSDTQNSLWHHYFSSLPLILIHAVDVCLAFIRTIGEINLTTDKLLDARKSVGFLLWSRDLWGNRMGPSGIKYFQTKFGFLNLICPLCKNKYTLNSKNLKMFFENSGLLCKHCGSYFQINF